jgi:hypothetical protein
VGQGAVTDLSYASPQAFSVENVLVSPQSLRAGLAWTKTSNIDRRRRWWTFILVEVWWS